MGRHSTQGEGTLSDYLKVIPRAWFAGHSKGGSPGPNERRLGRLLATGVIDEVKGFEEQDLGAVLDGVALVARNFPFAFEGRPINLYLADSHADDKPIIYFDPDEAGNPSLFVSKELFAQEAFTLVEVRREIVGATLEHTQLQLSPDAMRWVWSQATKGRVEIESLSDTSADYTQLSGASARVGQVGTKIFGLGIDLMVNALIEPLRSEPMARRFLVAIKSLLGPDHLRSRSPFGSQAPLRLSSVGEGIDAHGFGGVQTFGRPAQGQRLYVKTETSLFRIEGREAIDLEGSRLSNRREKRLLPRDGKWEVTVGRRLTVGQNPKDNDDLIVKKIVVVDGDLDSSEMPPDSLITQFEEGLTEVDRIESAARELRFSRLAPTERRAIEQIAATRQQRVPRGWELT